MVREVGLEHVVGTEDQEDQEDHVAMAVVQIQVQVLNLHEQQEIILIKKKLTKLGRCREGIATSNLLELNEIYSR